MDNASATTACERGWSDKVCFTSCADEPSLLHDSAGMIQVGAQARGWRYLPDESCTFTIYPLPASRPPASGGGERTTVIRLQFEYGALCVVGVGCQVMLQTTAGSGRVFCPFLTVQTPHLPETVDLGPDDTLDIYSNGSDGQKILSVTGQGEGIVNRVISSRSDSIVLRLTAGGGKGGTGFRVYWRVVESSPLDIYLITAIIITSILT